MCIRVPVCRDDGTETRKQCPSFSSTISFEAGSLPEPGAAVFSASLEAASNSHLPVSPPLRVESQTFTRAAPACPVGAGSWTLVLMILKKWTTPLNHLSCPTFSLRLLHKANIFILLWSSQIMKLFLPLLDGGNIDDYAIVVGLLARN